MPDQALLPASRRPCTRHVAPPDLDRMWARADAHAARTPIWSLPTDLRARHTGRLRQVADRTELSLPRRRRTSSDRRFQRSAALLSAQGLTAEDVIRLLDLEPHPEGGRYRQTFKDTRTVDGRAASTAIYFL